MSKSVSRNPTKGQIDHREQPYNSREIGPIDRVQLPLDNITSLHGIVFDIDLNLLRADGPLPLALGSARGFCEDSLVPMLARHPALRGAEVRDTGRNLHALVWFKEPVVFLDDGTRRRWAGYIRVIQAALPIDPDMPGITTLTRPVGSVNGKTGREVEIIRPGTPVPVAEVLELYGQMASRPFRTLAKILFGTDRISPCPICRAAGSSLAALDREGRCYGSCGKVKLDLLYDALLAPRALANKEADHAVA